MFLNRIAILRTLHCKKHILTSPLIQQSPSRLYCPWLRSWYLQWSYPSCSECEYLCSCLYRWPASDIITLGTRWFCAFSERLHRLPRFFFLIWSADKIDFERKTCTISSLFYWCYYLWLEGSTACIWRHCWIVAAWLGVFTLLSHLILYKAEKPIRCNYMVGWNGVGSIIEKCLLKRELDWEEWMLSCRSR